MNCDLDAKCVCAGQVRCRCAVERATPTLRRQNLSRNVKLDSKFRLRRLQLARPSGSEVVRGLAGFRWLDRKARDEPIRFLYRRRVQRREAPAEPGRPWQTLAD